MLQLTLKEIVDKLQYEINYFKTQVEKLKIEKKQQIISNKYLTIKLIKLEKDMQRKVSL